MDRYEVMAGKMAPLTDGAHRKWGFTGKVETSLKKRGCVESYRFPNTSSHFTKLHQNLKS